MIAGQFGDDNELLFEIELIADNGLELPNALTITRKISLPTREKRS